MDRRFGLLEKRDLTRIEVLYNRMVDRVPRDHREVPWIKFEPVRLWSEICIFSSIFEKILCSTAHLLWSHYEASYFGPSCE